MPSPDQQSTPIVPGLPTPSAGVGTADLKTESNDPQELRKLLDRARERLAFYESFDRIVGENIRRSGELMVETVALREQAQAIANQSAKERAEFEATRDADRDRYRALIQHALDEAAHVRPVIDGMTTRLQAVLDEIESGAADSDEPSISTQPAEAEMVSTTSDLVEPWATSADETVPVETPLSIASEEATADETLEAVPETSVDASADESTDTTEGILGLETAGGDTETAPEPDESTGPRTIDVLAHGVPNARIAISLQKMLRGLDVVTHVEAREFADGELRLTVNASDALPGDALSIWLTDNQGEITSSSDSVTEITFIAD